MAIENIPVEKHPLQPFLPKGSRILMLGSFPPKKERWSMEFFYPNWINDMWRIMGLIFFEDKDHFVAVEEDGRKGKRFDKDRCAAFAAEKGIAMYDTACEVRRLKDNASDKFLEIVTPTDLHALLERIPDCQAIVTTGQKATDVIIDTFGCTEPSVGECTECTFPIKVLAVPAKTGYRVQNPMKSARGRSGSGGCPHLHGRIRWRWRRRQSFTGECLWKK